MRRRACLGVLLLAAMAAPTAGATNAPPASGAIVVVAHPGVPRKHVTAAELASIFTSMMRNWPGDGGIVPFNYPPEHPLRTAFDRAVLSMTPDEVGRFWLDQRIRGTARPPRQVPDPALLVRLIARMPGGVGYVPEGLADGSVRVLARVVDGKVLPP